MSYQSGCAAHGCPPLVAHAAAAGQHKYWYTPSAAQVQCPSTLATQDLEAEVFLHMMRMWTESKAAASQQEAEALMNAYAVAGDKQAPPRYDGQLLAIHTARVCIMCPALLQVHVTADRNHIVLLHCKCTRTLRHNPRVHRQQFGGRGLGQALEQLAAPLKLGSVEFVPLLAKLGSALSLSSGACDGRSPAQSRLASRHTWLDVHRVARVSARTSVSLDAVQCKGRPCRT